MTTDCEEAARVFGCDEGGCEVEIEVSAELPHSAKAETTGRLVLGHSRVKLHRTERVETVLHKRPVRRLFRDRERSDVTGRYSFTGRNGKHRNLKTDYVLATP